MAGFGKRPSPARARPPISRGGLRRALHPRMNWRSLMALGLAAGLLLAAGPEATAQAGEAPRRPKLALVLSGGGAMGIAHVGAIQELERLGIRPDLVVGTSMGSIVGGLYASGLSGAQLQQAVETMNWDSIFDTTPPRAGLSYRQKQLQADFPVKATVGVARGKLRQPDSLLSDANLLLELRRLLGVQGAVESFDQLPIPFRAVATDIETGHKVVIDRGELAGAMRASMSVPGVFAPYSWDGKLLVDGGMADNVPIDVARDLGADVVIVVATQTPLAKGDEVRSALDVLGQTVTLLILANERQQLATLRPTDVLIPVDTGGLGAADFKKGALLIAAGRKAAAAKSAELSRISDVRGPAPPAPAPLPPPRIDYVRVENSSKLADKVILRQVEGFAGKPMDPGAVIAALQEVYALGAFTRVDYTVEARDGRTGLVVHAEQRAGDTRRLRPGLTIAGTDDGHTDLDVSVEYSMLQLDPYGSEARIIGVLGTRKRLFGEYFKVLDSRQNWFVAPSFDMQKKPVPVYGSDGYRLAEYDVAFGLVTLAAGRQFGGYGELRLGVQGGIGEAELESGFAIPRKVDLDMGQVFALAGVDTFDNPYFPTRGVKALLQWTLGAEDLGDVRNYEKIVGSGFWAAGSRRDTVVLNLEGGDTVDGRLPLHSLFALGGPFSFPGFNVDELTGETYTVARLMYRHRLTDNSESLLNLPLFAGVTLAAGNMWARHGDFDADDLRFGGAVFVGADTPIGPVFLSLGAADGGRKALYVFVGKPF